MSGSMHRPNQILLFLAGPALFASATAAAEQAPFVEIAGQAGLDFVHFNGMTGKEYFAEMMGAGVSSPTRLQVPLLI